MAEAVGAAIVGGFLAESTVVGTLTIGTIVGTTVVTAATLGATIALNAALAPNTQTRNNYQQQTTRQSLTARQRGYGRDKLGGAAAFWAVALNKNYDRAIIHCEGPIDGYESFWLDAGNSGVGPTGGTNVTTPWQNYIVIEAHLGGVGNPAVSPVLLADFPSDWPATAYLNGLAYTVTRAIQPTGSPPPINTYFPNGRVPDLRVIARLSKVYDPRNGAMDWDNQSTWAWSNNPALAILDYLTTYKPGTAIPIAVGFGLPQAWIDTDSFSAFADTCDDNGFTLGGVYRYDEAPASILARLLSTCDGELFISNGLIGIRGGQWDAPTVTISEANILSYEYEQANDKLARFNRVKITYTSPDHDYQQTEAQPWEDVANQTLTGEILTQDLDLRMVQVHAQARRLAKIALYKANPEHKFTNLVTDLAGLAAIDQRIVTLDIPSLNGLNTTFLVTRFVLNADGATCTMDLSHITPDAYAWNAGTEAGAPPPVV